MGVRLNWFSFLVIFVQFGVVFVSNIIWVHFTRRRLGLKSERGVTVLPVRNSSGELNAVNI